jgi:hypothetical protein
MATERLHLRSAGVVDAFHTGRTSTARNHSAPSCWWSGGGNRSSRSSPIGRVPLFKQLITKAKATWGTVTNSWIATGSEAFSPTVVCSRKTLAVAMPHGLPLGGPVRPSKNQRHQTATAAHSVYRKLDERAGRSAPGFRGGLVSRFHSAAILPRVPLCQEPSRICS